MNRSYLNLALLALVAGLGAAVWLSQKKEEQGPPLIALAPESITRIAVEHPGKPAIRLEKKDGRWELIEPVRAATDAFEVNGILAVAELDLKATLDASANKTELELDPPKYSVTFNDTRVDLGGTEPIKYRRYAASGDTIGLVDDPPSAALDADYSDLVSKAIVPEGAELQRIELPALTLEKNSDGVWSSANAKNASTAQLAQLAESWRRARAMWNAAEPESGSSGDAVKLTLSDGRVIELRVHATDPQLIIANPALRVHYTLSKALTEELLKLPSNHAPKSP